MDLVSLGETCNVNPNPRVELICLFESFVTEFERKRESHIGYIAVGSFGHLSIAQSFVLLFSEEDTCPIKLNFFYRIT